MPPDRTDSVDPRQTAQAALEFARNRLGPATERILRDPANQAMMLSHIRHGAAFEDAVLLLAHQHVTAEKQVADEFLAYFLDKLLWIGSISLTPQLRSFLDTGDLVNSVMGSLWREFERTRFTTQAEFLSYLAQRLRWKVRDETRRSKSIKRGGAARVERQWEDVAEHQDGPGALTQIGMAEERDRLAVALVRLPQRDQEILRLHLLNHSVDEIAKELQLNPEATRKAIQRAAARVRRMFEPESEG